MAAPPAATASWKARLSDAWLTRNRLSRSLWPLSLVMGLLVRTRSALYRQGWLTRERLPVPVIVVGNVVVGGAGKTPTVMALVRHLQGQGQRPGVISRGYGRSVAPGTTPEAPLEVEPDTPAHLAGDEPLLIRQTTGVPVVVARQRSTAGRALLARHPDTTVLICDDGLQHLALHADVAVAVFDERGIGNGWLLPAGLLREPWPAHPSRTVDMVLHIRNQATAPPPHPQPLPPLPCPPHTDLYRATRCLADQAVSAHGQHAPLQSLASTTQLPSVALAGIAKPQVFFDMLSAAGLHLDQCIALDDHHDFSADSNAFNQSDLLHAIQHKRLFLTEKDAVKLFPLIRQLAPQAGYLPLNTALRTPGAWAVPLTLTPEPGFFAAIDLKLSLLNGHQTA